jgi:hypothetical protein
VSESFNSAIAYTKIVRQHINIHHYKQVKTPKCSRCQTAFPKHMDLIKHGRPLSCKSRPPPEIPEVMPSHIFAQIQKLKLASLSGYEEWFTIWQILFPGEDLPDSPYPDEREEDFIIDKKGRAIRRWRIILWAISFIVRLRPQILHQQSPLIIHKTIKFSISYSVPRRRWRILLCAVRFVVFWRPDWGYR